MARILVVDDEEDILNLVKTILVEDGHEVHTASNGAEALQHLKKTKYDAAIIDVVMPNVDGLVLCRQIRRTSRMRDTPVLIFSALGQGVQTMLGEGEEADAYLNKPFDKKTLLEKVNCLLGVKQ